MKQDRDPFLSELFAVSEQPLSDVSFLADLVRRIEREQRIRTSQRFVTLALILGAMAMSVPWLIEPVVVITGLFNSGLYALGMALQSPIAWTAGAALLVAFGPGMYLWWTRRI